MTQSTSQGTQRQRTALIMAGGTGGHIFPGLAVAQALRERGWNVRWLGAPGSMESRIVPAQGFPLETIEFSGVRGKGIMTLAFLPMRLLRAFWQALAVVRRVKPDVVVGLGGYISFPGGMMAVLAGKPLVLHEQNSVAGMANKVLASVSHRIFTAFPNVFPKGRWVGNPLRQAFTEQPAPEQRFAGRSGPLRLLVVGGSLGAAALNDAVPAALGLLPAAERPQVLHQAGEKQIEALRTAYARARVDGDLRPFIDDMASAYAEADVVICRAGAATIAELAAAGAASLLVPYPHAVDDHQTGNARFLADRGAAYLLPQAELNAERLAAILAGLDRTRLLDIAVNARALAKPDAAAAVASVCAELAGAQGQ